MSKKVFWIDLEMTGLDDKVDTILEVAVAITNWDMEILEEYERVVYQPQSVLDNMNDWCKKHHGESGLTAKVPTGTPLAQVEKEMLELIGRQYSKEKQIVLAGNSVGNDARFLHRYMPDFSKRLHYRIIDVSSLKEIFRSKYSVQFEKKKAHRAIDDIRESIAELKHYLSFIKVEKK